MKNIEHYQPAKDLLHDHIILVTGAGAGIGAAAAENFAAHGATVILLGRTVKKLEQTYDSIVNAGYPEPAIYPMDLEGATYEDHEQLAITINKEFGRLDGLLHNAGFLGALMPITQYDLKLWASILQINLTAPFLMSRALLPVLNKSKSASVVFTSSGVAHQGRAYWGAYAASKAAVDNLMQTMADELETNTNIRFNSIDPGRVNTHMRRLAYPGEDPNTLPQPQDIMPSYLYLMGDDSKDINGEIIAA